MKFTVVWLPDAEEELAAIWVASIDRNAVTSATNRAERLLRTDAATLGESRKDDQRVYFESPLVLHFRVRPLDRLVEVFHVHRPQ
ncbi:MAG: hypothetical protein K2X38_12315 [Gemmataceae bacterium]|nr:hypothetical protein [Gemmataceae bacterium]